MRKSAGPRLRGHDELFWAIHALGCGPRASTGRGAIFDRSSRDSPRLSRKSPSSLPRISSSLPRRREPSDFAFAGSGSLKPEALDARLRGHDELFWAIHALGGAGYRPSRARPIPSSLPRIPSSHPRRRVPSDFAFAGPGSLKPEALDAGLRGHDELFWVIRALGRGPRASTGRGAIFDRSSRDSPRLSRKSPSSLPRISSSLPRRREPSAFEPNPKSRWMPACAGARAGQNPSRSVTPAKAGLRRRSSG